MKRYKVAFATGSRADYGIVRNYLKLLNNNPQIDLSILVTGALLSEKYGSAISIIENDGFNIALKNNVEQATSSITDTINIMAEVLKGFGKHFASHKYDLLIILGDRYEIYSVAIAASMQHIPILHLHGGEITLANYDEFIRHSITKMAQFHITSTEEYRHRVIQLGEKPENVYYLGALGAENCLEIDLSNVPEDIKQQEINFCVLFHPETLNDINPAQQMEEVLCAIEPYVSKYHFLFIGSNADTYSDGIVNKSIQFCEKHSNCYFYKNLHPDAYHYILKQSYALIGNSSSGIIEAPSLGCRTINIGDRQTGRVKGDSIIDVRCDRLGIMHAIDQAIKTSHFAITDTPYYKSNSAMEYYNTTCSILNRLSGLSYKEFHDINF